MNSPEDCSCLAKGQTSGLTRPARFIGVNHRAAQHEIAVRLVQRQQLRAGLSAPARQRRARRVHSGARVDLLLPVVRDVIDVAADHRVGLQARRWQRVVEDLRGSGLLHQIGRASCRERVYSSV